MRDVVHDPGNDSAPDDQHDWDEGRDLARGSTDGQQQAAADGAIPVNFEEESVGERLNELTGGKGAEKCIACDAFNRLDLRSGQTDNDGAEQSHVLLEMICVSRGATILSIPGV
jgi:hypothetical protein